MTTTPVASISDDLLAEIELAVSFPQAMDYADIENRYVLAIIKRLHQAEQDAKRLMYVCEEFDGFSHVSKDKHDYAIEVAEEGWRSEPTPLDMLNGIRRLIDTAMQESN